MTGLLEDVVVIILWTTFLFGQGTAEYSSWFKGNTNAHTINSEGDSPDLVAARTEATAIETRQRRAKKTHALSEYELRR
jgi:hypothetical protein